MAHAQPLQDLSGWVEHKDASGRTFLANQLTNETRWLWNKWSLNGRVFCVNAVTSERVWQDDMSPEVRIAAGIPPPPSPNYSSLPVRAPTSEEFSTFHNGTLNRPSKRAKLQGQAYEHIRCEPCSSLFPSRSEWLVHRSSVAHQRASSTDIEGVRSSRINLVEGGLASNGKTLLTPLFEHDVKRGSRFSSVLPSSSTFRAAPSPPVSREIPPRRRGSSFRPRSCRARVILSCITCVNPALLLRTARLYDRDIASPSATLTLVAHEGRDRHRDSGGTSPAEAMLVGTSSTVEKMYLRLTSAPNPADVRPGPVLKRALKHVKKQWASQSHDYEWVCSQLKSIRQDLQIQHIETTLTLDVYETHARIGLENGDFGEFNTCVAQLSELYQRLDRLASVRDEFASYRILYDVLVGEKETEHARMLASTSTEERERPGVRFAMLVREAVLGGNYECFFRLYASPPPRTMVTFVLDQLVDYVRSRALAAMCCAYSPGRLCLKFTMSQLGWAAGELKAAVAFCETVGVVLIDNWFIDTKASRSRGVSVMRKRRGLITAAGVQ
jgi:SAC3/GANP family